MDERREQHGAQRLAERVQDRVVRGGEAGEQDGDPGPDEQPPRVVLGPAGEREQTGGREGPADHEPDDAGAQPLVVARRGEREHGGAQREHRAPPGRMRMQPVGSGHRISALRAAPDSSALGMKPTAPLRPTSGPKSEPSRLETSTTVGPPLRPVSRDATSNPSRSGRWTSSSTSCGSSSAAASRADAPSTASPTTSKPSASRSALACVRKPEWSSTIKTFTFL